jgi:hypothetical protein
MKFVVVVTRTCRSTTGAPLAGGAAQPATAASTTATSQTGRHRRTLLAPSKTDISSG